MIFRSRIYNWNFLMQTHSKTALSYKRWQWTLRCSNTNQQWRYKSTKPSNFISSFHFDQASGKKNFPLCMDFGHFISREFSLQTQNTKYYTHSVTSPFNGMKIWISIQNIKYITDESEKIEVNFYTSY